MLFNPRWNRIFDRYQNGQAGAAAIIGFTSGLVFEIGIFLFAYQNIIWNFKKVIIFFLIYITISLMGWLSLVKLRDYELEKN